MAEIADALLRVNLVASIAILAVLLLRLPARRAFGPEVAYWLWAAPPLAAVATLTPCKTGLPPVHTFLNLAPTDFAPQILAAWGVGLIVALALLGRAQARFLAEARAGRAGPAVVGVIIPRIVMPKDDGRYSEEERALIRAHEREHIARKDPRAGALIAFLQCLGWFNPLVHFGAHVARLDQELACDAAVLRRHPRARALYAKTLLKTQLAGAALPLGCYWPSRSRHPLEVRVELLRHPARDGGLHGPLLVMTGVLSAAILAWAVEPRIPFTPPAAAIVAEQQAMDRGNMTVLLISWPAAPARR